MLRENLNDLVAFLAVARERSFTRAAAQLGVSQPSLSHTIRSLEARLGVRLLTRTTRSVSTTEAGARLLHGIAPRMEEIETELAAMSELRVKPTGTVHIMATDYVIKELLWPRLSIFVLDYSSVKIEFVTDYGLNEGVAMRYDVAIRCGYQLEKGMTAAQITPDTRMVIVGSPAYLTKRPAPKTPQGLTNHECINLRQPTHDGLYGWDLSKGRRELQVRVDGQLTFNGIYQVLDAVLAGHGLAYLPEDLARPYVIDGSLMWVLEDWFPISPGYYAYYSSLRPSSRALALVVDALRYKATTP